MSDRCDYFFRQRVTEAELDLGFELLERADRNLASDIGVYGIVSGAVPSSHAPIADLTIDLTAPACAYDRLGQRIFYGTAQRVDVSVDATGIPTDVSDSASERWVGVFIRFHRLLSDARTDGNSQQVFFRRDESFELVVRQGPQAPIGAAPKVALVDAELLLCDVRRHAGQSQILAADIDVSRRQVFVFAQSTAVAVVAGLWTAISKAAGTVQKAFDSIDALLGGHFGATANRHRAQDVDYAPHGFIASSTVKSALDELVDDLSSQATTPGAARVATKAIPGVPNALPASTVDTHLAAILGWLNGHLGAASAAHAATAIAAMPFAFLATKNVQSQLQELVADLQSAAAAQGAALIGSQALGGAPRAVAATGLRDQLVAILTHVNAHIGSGDHDVRYLRRIYNGNDHVPGASSKLFTHLTAPPDLVTVAYNLVDATGAPQSPQFFQGPLSISLQLSVDKQATGGPAINVLNTSGATVFVTVNAYVLG